MVNPQSLAPCQNDEIEPHNHNDYPLLYKEAEILTSNFRQIIRVPEVLHITCNICTHDLPDMYALSPWASGIHIRQIPRAHGITIIHM